MTKEIEVIEGNKLIAEFMGMFYDKLGSYMKVWVHGDEPTFFHCEWHPDDYKVEDNKFIAWEFAPHKNWCQLMPVVEKIEAVIIQGNICGSDFPEHVFVTMSGKTCWVVIGDNHKIFEAKEDEKIVSAWNAIVKFLQWKNEQEKILRIGAEERKYGNRAWE